MKYLTYFILIVLVRVAECFMDYDPNVNISTLPQHLDWRTKGVMNDITNQGQCGSCWAHSTIANIETRTAIKYKYLPKLSIQYLVDCDYNDGGCKGGTQYGVYNFAHSVGLCSQTDYNHDNTNSCSSCIKKINVTDMLRLRTENEMMIALQNYTLLAEMDATVLQSYFIGIIGDSINCTSNVNHMVNIVGYGGIGKNRYWIVRNSYGKEFGEGGYFRIIRGVNKCAIENHVVIIDTLLLQKDSVIHNNYYLIIIIASVFTVSYFLIFTAIIVVLFIKFNRVAR